MLLMRYTNLSRTESSEELTEIAIDDKGNWSFVSIKQEKRT